MRSTGILKKIAIAPLLGLIWLYKGVISPLTPATCRHYPTCSAYALGALKLHGLVRGSLLAANRITRCHPWGTHGIDPVPLILVKKLPLRKYGIWWCNHHPSSNRLKR